MLGKQSLWRALAAAIVVAAAGGACSTKHDGFSGAPPLDPSDHPPRPVDVTATVALSSVTLSWEVSDGTGVIEYRVYRSEDSANDFEYLASTGQTAYSDLQVANGVTYCYEIAAVKGALEGERSVPVTAVPGVFGGSKVIQ